MLGQILYLIDNLLSIHLINFPVHALWQIKKQPNTQEMNFFSREFIVAFLKSIITDEGFNSGYSSSSLLNIRS